MISSSHQLKILPVTQAMQAEAFGILGTGVKDPLSYVDATSITLMRALGVTKIMTFVAGMERYGLQPVRD